MALTQTLRPIKVTIDGEVDFDAVTDGQLWNGWECPRFDRANAEKVVEWMNNDPFNLDENNLDRTVLSWDGDVVVIDEFSFHGDEGYEPERIAPVDGLWSIGAWSWVWSESA